MHASSWQAAVLLAAAGVAEARPWAALHSPGNISKLWAALVFLCCCLFLATKALLSESHRFLFLFYTVNIIADFIVLIQLGIVPAV